MIFHFLTPFPKIIDTIINESILGKAISNDYIDYHIYNLFEFTDSSNMRLDDYPFGGGSGMVMKPEPVFKAFNFASQQFNFDCNTRVIFPTPDGKQLTQELSSKLVNCDQILFINGHYKGIDQRIRDNIVTDEISIGDYVLTGGELASMVIVDSIVRLIPGVLNNIESANSDSFSNPLLDGPHYTRPENFNGMKVPNILLSGHHREIDNWIKDQREKKTIDRRPDLWEKYIRFRKKME